MRTPFRRWSILAALAIALWPSPARADAGDEMIAAYEKLRGSAYRKREIMSGFAGLGGTAATVTEHVGDRSRMVVETEVPSFGRIRQEQVTVGSRSAVLTHAPGITAKLEQMKRSLTVNSVRNLLQQIASVGAAASTGGLTSLQLLQTALSAAATAKSTAEARIALDRAAEAYRTWQVVPEEEGEDFPALVSDGAGPAAALAAGMLRVEKKVEADAQTIRYTSRPAGVTAGGDMTTVLTVNAATGLPVSEEMFFNGQRMMRVEYFDHGAPIAIEVPDCLR
jgi:hypothetical protein